MHYARRYQLTGKLLYGMVMVLLLTAAVQAQDEYKMGPGDVLDIKFWQDPTLNSTVVVNQDGTIALDIIGKVQASGKTTTELQTDIVRQMSRLNSRISQTVVRVTQFNYNYVFVTGQARTPGKQSFERIPDLWTIINEAGGVMETGDLSRVTIVRGGADAGKVEVVNVAQAIAKGELDKLPKIRREDTIEIPRSAANLPGPNLSDRTMAKDVIYVVGAVGRPGPIKFEPGVDILEAVALAGGPVGNANLKKVRVVTKDGRYAQTIHVDLKEYTEKGVPARYTMKKEDIIYLPQKGSFLQSFLGTAATAAGIITATILIYDQVSGNNNAGAAAAP